MIFLNEKSSSILLIASLAVIAVLLAAFLIWIYILAKKRKKENALLKEMTNKLEYLAKYDSLTALPNKTTFTSDAWDLIIGHVWFSVMLMDVDNFKFVNDTYGHGFGDMTLFAVAKVLKEADPNSARAYRYAGDEFLMIVRSHDKVYLGELAKKIQETLGKGVNVGNNTIATSVSIGISMFPEDGNNPDDLCSSADSAMYFVKDRTKMGFSFFNLNTDFVYKKSGEVESELREALKKDRVKMVFQPIVDTKTLNVSSFESLMRIEGMPIGPDIFIPIAEKTGLIVELGRTAARKSIEFLARLREAGFPGCHVGINFSGVQFLDKTFFDFVDDVLYKNGISSNCLIIELTENGLSYDKNLWSVFSENAIDKNMRLSLDDFGTGYSSLSRLLSFPFFSVKLDKSIIADERGKSLVPTLVSLIHSLHMQVISEGIETRDQFEFVRDSGVDFVQGYYFSKPVELSKAIESVKDGTIKVSD